MKKKIIPNKLSNIKFEKNSYETNYYLNNTAADIDKFNLAALSNKELRNMIRVGLVNRSVYRLIEKINDKG